VRDYAYRGAILDFEYLMKENGKDRYSNKGKDGYNNKKDDPSILPFCFTHLYFALHP
jgi:hypothetical protein